MYLPKANPGILIAEGVTAEKMVNRAMVHLSQGVRHHAEGCVALGWNLASVVNNPLEGPSYTPLYLCLPPVWGTVGGDLLDLLHLHECKWKPTERKQVFKA
jgi:hypothetical protein